MEADRSVEKEDIRIIIEEVEIKEVRLFIVSSFS